MKKNKADIVNILHQKTNHTKTAITDILNSFIFLVGDLLKNNHSIAMKHFGTFTTRTLQGSSGVNPRNGKVIKLNQRKYPKFKASPSLKMVTNHTNNSSK